VMKNRRVERVKKKYDTCPLAEEQEQVVSNITLTNHSTPLCISITEHMIHSAVDGWMKDDEVQVYRERRDERAVAIVFGMRMCRKGRKTSSLVERRTANCRRRCGLMNLDQATMRIVLSFLVRLCLRFSLDSASSVCCFSPDGKMILCASDDKTLKLYCTSSGACLSTLHGHTAGVQSCCFSPDGSTILSGGKDTKLILWDVNGKLRKTFVGHSNVVKKCCFSPDGNTFIADFRRTIKIFDATTRQVLYTLEGHFSDDGCACFSPDGTLILGVDGQSLKLWRVETGNLAQTFYGHSDDVSSCCFAPDGKKILSGSLDWNLILWDVQGRLLRRFKGHSSSITSCTFSPDGNTIVSSSLDNTIILWDTATSNSIGMLEEHKHRVRSATVSRDGKTLLSSSGQTMKLWNMKTRNCLQTLRAGADITSCCFSPDGERIICASGSLNLWD